MKAHKRAIIIGTPTFGKDSIQLIFDLLDNSSLRVTAAKWWIPDLDIPIEEAGVQPDVFVDPTANTNNLDQYTQSAIQIFELQE